ncbi:hypothetical protein V6N13_062851 [Hibiscus sabdariffa]|uniref:Uncharacterized protein n=1 Tax=Hibiscus sabdariffa TaxID=183260 RepID=A0ABR2NDH9_9ROSI
MKNICQQISLYKTPPTTQQKCYQKGDLNPHNSSIQAKTQISMGASASFFCCFSGSKVTSEEDDRIPPTSTPAKARNEDKPKENSRKKSPPIPVNYFPIGARLNLL